MSRGSPIEDDDLIARLEAVCERVEGTVSDQERLVKREEKLLQNARELVAIANRQIDRQEELLDRQEKFLEAGVLMLEQATLKITEKGIWDALAEYEKKQEQSRRFYRGYPGVPERILNGESNGTDPRDQESTQDKRPEAT